MIRLEKYLVCLFVFCFTFLSADVPLDPDLTIGIPMRDGTILPTDLYFPPDREVKHPCILMRSPAGRKEYPWRAYAALAQRGYVIAIQDTRSAQDKAGRTIPFLADGWGVLQDGYDTVEWLAYSAYTNGQIGTIGFSALGITQQMLAPSAPPSLKCQYIGVAAGCLYHHAVYPGGQLLKSQVEGWLGLYAKDPAVYGFLRSQPYYNEFWSKFNTLSVAHQVTAPAIHYGGWFDIFLKGTLDSFAARQERGAEGARGKQKLLIGPWAHLWPHSMDLGDFKVPENARQMPEAFHPTLWFDHYLKGMKNHVEAMPPVTYYVMGPLDGSAQVGNEWRTADRWPVPADAVPFYLGEDHQLVVDVPAKHQAYAYRHALNAPVPTVGGRNLFMESGPKDQRSIEERDDVLVFTSQPLEEDLEVTGEIIAKLYVSSDAPESDVVVRFCDVYPDGKSILMADGICKVKSHGLQAPFEMHFDLWSTSFIAAKGHSLRISISGSNYPKYERNTSDELTPFARDDSGIVHNQIHLGEKYPSRLILPIVTQN